MPHGNVYEDLSPVSYFDTEAIVLITLQLQNAMKWASQLLSLVIMKFTWLSHVSSVCNSWLTHCFK